MLVVSAGLDSFRVFTNFSTTKGFKYLFFTAIKSNIMAGAGQETKQLYFEFTSYINLLDVFHPYCRIWNNRTGTIIQFALKSSPHNAYMRLCHYQFYLLTLPARLLHSTQSFSFELKRNTI